MFDFFSLSLAHCSLLQEPLKVAQRKMYNWSLWLEKQFYPTWAVDFELNLRIETDFS